LEKKWKFKQGEKERTKIGANIRCIEKYKNNCNMANAMIPYHQWKIKIYRKKIIMKMRRKNTLHNQTTNNKQIKIRDD